MTEVLSTRSPCHPLLVLSGFFAFLIAGLILNFDETVSLLVITCVVVGWIICAKLNELFGERVRDTASLKTVYG